MSEKLGKNLNQLMEEANLNAEELSRRIGLPASTIKKIRKNNGANPTLSTLSPLARYFSLSVSQLIGDEAIPDSRIKGSYTLNVETLTHIFLISWQEAITWPLTNNQPHSVITTEHLYSKNAFALLVEDDAENLAKGTALLIDPSVEPLHRDFMIVYRKDQKSPVLKQALFDDGEIYLKSVTQGYNIIPLTSEHRILGVVIEYKKHFRTLSL